MNLTVHVHIHPSPASARPLTAPAASTRAVAIDQLLEQYVGLTPVDMIAQIHALCGDRHLDRDSIADLLVRHGGQPEDVARALTDLFGDTCPELPPEARRLRAAMIRFAACILDGLVADDEPRAVPTHHSTQTPHS